MKYGKLNLSEADALEMKVALKIRLDWLLDNGQAKSVEAMNVRAMLNRLLVMEFK